VNQFCQIGNGPVVQGILNDLPERPAVHRPFPVYNKASQHAPR
jgi:hypothetical protein